MLPKSIDTPTPLTDAIPRIIFRAKGAAKNLDALRKLARRFERDRAALIAALLITAEYLPPDSDADTLCAAALAQVQS